MCHHIKHAWTPPAKLELMQCSTYTSGVKLRGQRRPRIQTWHNQLLARPGFAGAGVPRPPIKSRANGVQTGNAHSHATADNIRPPLPRYNCTNPKGSGLVHLYHFQGCGFVVGTTCTNPGVGVGTAAPFPRVWGWGWCNCANPKGLGLVRPGLREFPMRFRPGKLLLLLLLLLLAAGCC